MNAERDPLHPAKDYAAISQRIIDCCLRENIRGLIDQASPTALPDELQQCWPGPAPAVWLCLADLTEGEIWVPVRLDAPLQT